MKKLLLVTLMVTALSACERSGSNEPKAEEVVTPPAVEEPVVPEETREEMIERELNLPPEPDETENNATILGIDVNGNNIRDDVERYIAFKYYDDKPLMKMHFENARQWNDAMSIVVSNPENVTMDTYLEMANEVFFVDALFNTPPWWKHIYI